NARPVDPSARAVGVDFKNRRAAAVLAGVAVRLRPHRDVKLRSAAIEHDVAGGVSTGRQVEELLRRAARLQVAPPVLESNDRGGVADVQVVATECETKRQAQSARTGTPAVRRRTAGRWVG